MASMAVSMLACPVIMTASVSGATCLRCSRTSMPVRPGMRRSRMATSNLLFSNTLSAARPSGQTVTSWPKRGSSERMNSCSDFSSSTNRMRRLLCGVGKRFLLDGLSRLKREADRKGASLIQTRAKGVDLSSVLTDDAVADGQAQPRAFAGAAAGKERLENVLQRLRGHAAAGIGKIHFRHAVALAQLDGQDSALIHAV